MNNLDKVIQGLVSCNSASCQKCPYNENKECNNRGFFYSQAIEDALTLLKEREAVPVDTKITDKNTVMSWLEGLTQDDWRKWHSDSEVQETAKAALAMLKEQEAEIERLKRPDCEHAEHDGIGCLGYAGCAQDDEPIEACKECEKYTGNIYRTVKWE